MMTAKSMTGAAPSGRLRRLMLIASLSSVLAVSSFGVASQPGPQLVAIKATPMQAGELLSSFDLAETRNGAEVEAILWPGDAARLDEVGLEWRVLDRDLSAEHARALLATTNVPKSWPSTEDPRNTYRKLDDHHQELRDLANGYPQFADLVDLGRSLEGRDIIGLRIAIGDAEDGRPYAYFDGAHHAREWPSAEYVTGFAHRLVSDALAGEPRVTGLLKKLAVVLVPIVNPDGFNISRSAPHDGHELLGAVGVAAYWRKNARSVYHHPEQLPHAGPLSLGTYGVDPNRNYPFLWGSGEAVGGFGASGNPAEQTYEGTAVASEPEVAAVTTFIRRHNVTALISNHTYGRLVLYPWGHTRTQAPDHAVLRALAEDMAAANWYRPQIGLDLYATTGTMSDWAYAATGSLAYTFEHGSAFHPAYGVVITPRPSNEEAYLRLMTAAADSSKHSIIQGKIVDAQGNGIQAELKLTKVGTIPTYESTTPEPITLSMITKPDGTFTWHVNPSVGPIDQGDYTLEATTILGTASLQVGVARGQVRSLPDLKVG